MKTMTAEAKAEIRTLDLGYTQVSIEEAKRRFPMPGTGPRAGFETREPDLFRLLDAIDLAARAHCGQFDKGGEPYLWHVLRVGISLLPDIDAAVLGILHDVREDSDTSEEEIQVALGDRHDLYLILGTLTRGEKQPYEEYIRNIAFAPYIATRVKLADLRDNLDPRRLDKLGEKCGSDLMYTLKCRYREAFRLLSGAIESGCAK